MNDQEKRRHDAQAVEAMERSRRRREAARRREYIRNRRRPTHSECVSCMMQRHGVEGL